MTIRQLFKQAFIRWWAARPATLGAALSFYVAFSLTPLLSFALILFGKIIPQQLLEQQIISTSYSVGGENIAKVIHIFLQNTHGFGESLTAIIVGIGLLIFGSLGVFSQLQYSLDVLWNAPTKEGIMVFLREKTIAFIIFIILGVILIFSLLSTIIVSVFLKYISGYLSPFNLSIIIPVGQIITFLTIILVIYCIYRFMADVPITSKARWLGSIGTALFFIIGEYILRYYLGSYSFSSSYGALGTLAVLLIWVYYSSQIFFYGAAWTYVLNEGLKK